MSFVSDFKEFALKGNVLDLAVGVIIGAAFGKIVDSLVKDVLMPVLGLFTGGIDFKSLFFVMSRESYATVELAEKAGVAVVRYGLFLQAVVDFAIIALAIFVFISQIQRMQRAKQAEPALPAPPAPPAEDIVLLREIRDALRRGA